MPANTETLELARRIRKLERQALIRKQPQLANSSIEDGALTAVDADGLPTMTIGNQFDGTNGSIVLVGPTPPAPAGLAVTNETPGGLTIVWDGTFVGGEMSPMDWLRTSVHVAPDGSWDPDEFDPQTTNMPVASISSATGGQAWVPTEPGVDYVVVLTAWTTAGRMSALSAPVIAQSLPVGLDTSAPEWIALMQQAAAASTAAANAQTASAAAAAAAQAAGQSADNAGQAAVAAQGTANTAVTNAQTAQTAATNAQTAANNAAAAVAAVQVGGANMVLDSSFEGTAALSWTATGSGATLSRDATRGMVGTKSMKVVIGAAWPSGAQYVQGACVVGSKYVFSTWLYSQTAAKLRVAFDNIQNAQGVVPFQDITLVANTWTRVVLQGTATSVNTVVTIRNQPFSPAASIIWVDAVQIEEGTLATSWKPATAELQAASAAAQAAADAAASAASAAQGTANTAVTNAATAQAAAVAAATAATNAGTAAVAAQTSADGKRRVIYATFPPTNEANQAGDTWFVRRSAATATEPVGTVYAQYEGMGGTSWTKRDLSSAVFSSIDAGKITFGTMSGERIQVGSLVIGQMTGLQTALDGKATPAQVAAAQQAAQSYAAAQAATAQQAAEASAAVYAAAQAQAAYDAAAALANAAQATANANPTDAELAAAAQAAQQAAIAAAATTSQAQATAAQEAAEAAAATHAEQVASAAQAAAIAAAATTSQNQATAAQQAAIAAAASDAATKANQAKADAIAAAATAAQTKADAAQAAAIAAAATDAAAKALAAENNAKALAQQALDAANANPTDAELAAAASAAQAAAIAAASTTSQAQATAAQQAAISTAATTAASLANSAASAAQTAAISAAATAAATAYGPTKTLVGGWVATGKTTINGGAIETDTINAAQINAGAITAAELAVGAVIAEKILAGEVKAAAIAAGAILAEKIAAGAITAEKLAAGSVTAISLDAQSVATAILKAGIIQSQLIMTGVIQVGNSTWNTTTGLTIPQSDGGAINFPVDGSPATIYAHLIARSLNVVDGLTITGYGEVKGEVVLTNGITKPSQPPRLSTYWPSTIAAALTSSVDASVDNGDIYSGLTNHHSNPDWAVAAISFFGGGLRIVNKRTGALVEYPDSTSGKAWTPDFYPVGGVTYAGGSYYVLGADNTRSGDYYVYRLNTSFDKTAEVRIGSLAFGEYQSRMGPGNPAGTLPGMYWSASSGALNRRTFNAALTSQTDTNLISNAGRQHIGGAAYEGTADKLHVQTQSGAAYYFEGDVKQNSGSLSRAGDANSKGLIWDTPTGRFISFDNYGKLWYYSGLMVPQTTLNVAYSWYDGDGTVRETEVGPTASTVLTKGKWLKATFDPPPDEKVTDPTKTDKANRVGIYASTGANALRLQKFTVTPVITGGAVTTAEHSWTVDIPTTTNKVAESANGFAVAGVNNSPGVFRSAAGGFSIDGASGGSVGTGTFRDSISALIAASFSNTYKASTETINVTTNGTPVSKTITFATPFPASGPIPTVTASVRSGSPQLFDVGVSGESRTGFTLTMNRSSGALTANCAWHATTASA